MGRTWHSEWGGMLQEDRVANQSCCESCEKANDVRGKGVSGMSIVKNRAEIFEASRSVEPNPHHSQNGDIPAHIYVSYIYVKISYIHRYSSRHSTNF